MDTQAEQHALLSILNAWKKDCTADEVPWHITDLGWLAYQNHANPKVRAAAANNPYSGCRSDRLQQEREDYRLNVKVFS